MYGIDGIDHLTSPGQIRRVIAGSYPSGPSSAKPPKIVTLIEGEGASAASTRRVTEWLAENHPDVEHEIHHGGQPLYPYYVGIE